MALTSAAFGPGELLFAIPKHKTILPGEPRESQSDVFLLVRHKTGPATYTIEGKVDEPFGPTVEDWLANPSPGKTERLKFICGMLGIEQCPPDVITSYSIEPPRHWSKQIGSTRSSRA